MCEEVKKDYSLLRPFDLEAAKRGEAVCIGDLMCLYLDSNDRFVMTRIAGGGCDGAWCSYAKSDLRMAPLAWVEGKPVYRGDRLYVKVPEPRTGSVVTAEFPQDDDTISTFRAENGAVPKIRHDQLTWTPPKVKREGWIVFHPRQAITEDEAKGVCSGGPGLLMRRVEWEESA